MTERPIPTWDDIDKIMGREPRRSGPTSGDFIGLYEAMAAGTSAKGYVALAQQIAADGQSRAAESSPGAMSPAIEAARSRLVEARVALAPRSRFGGTAAEAEAAHRAAAEAYARGCVSAVMEAAIRDGLSEAQIVTRISETTSRMAQLVAAEERRAAMQRDSSGNPVPAVNPGVRTLRREVSE